MQHGTTKCTFRDLLVGGKPCDSIVTRGAAMGVVRRNSTLDVTMRILTNQSTVVVRHMSTHYLLNAAVRNCPIPVLI